MDQTYLNDFIKKYVEKTCGSKDWTQKYRLHMADSRSSAGFRFSIKEILYPIVASKGEGSYFFDIDNNKYIDITMGYGTLLFGHSYPPIVNAIQKQIMEGIQLGPQNNKAGEVAGLITNLTGVDRVAFCNSGTEANMTAIRLARLVTGKNKIVVFQDSYHGFYDATLVTSTENFGIPKSIFEGIPSSLIADIIILPYGDLKSVEALYTYKDDLAGVIVEPVRSRFPEVQPVEFLKELREATKQLNAILIFDEVITGFRCHIQGAQNYFGVKADLVVYGKIIGGGLPLGIVAGRKDCMDGIDGGYWQYHDKSFPVASTTFFGGTFFKNPLSIAAAYAVINEIEKEGPELQNSLNKKTEQLVNQINDYCYYYNLPISVVHFSSLFRFKCLSNIDIFFYHLLYKGLYVWEGRNCFLSKAHSDQDINLIKNIILESLEDLRKANIISSTNSNSNLLTSLNAPLHAISSISLNIKSLPTPSDIKSLWVLSQVQEEANTAYNEVILINIKGNLDRQVLYQSLVKLSMRHEALRMQFSEDGDYINFLDNIEINFDYISYKDQIFPRNSQEIKAFIMDQVNKSFILSKAPLFSNYLMKFSDEHYILIVSAHHTIMDGQSSDIFLSDLFTIYEQIINRKDEYKLNKSLQFSRFLKEKNSNFKSIEESNQYWMNLLRSLPEALEFKNSKARPHLKTYKGGHFTFSLSQELKEKLKKISSSNHSTLFMTLLSSLNILIYRYTNQKDFIIGVPAFTRNSPESKYMIGFATTLFPIRVPIDPTIDFKSYLHKVRKSVFAIYDYPYFETSSIVQELNLEWNRARSSPIFDIVLNMETEIKLSVCRDLNFETIALHSPFKWIDFKHFTQEPIYIESGKAKFDLSFNFLDGEDGITASIEFSKDLFDEDIIIKMSNHFLVLLEGICDDPYKPINQLPLLTQQERTQLLVDWNKVSVQEPINKTIHQLFEEQVIKNPTLIAVTFDNQHLTYQELNYRSNQFARYLKNQGVKPETLVAVLLDRSVELVISILGILKIGSAYVPLDLSYPQGRLEYMLSDANVKWLVTNQTLLSYCKNYKDTIILVDSNQLIREESIDDLNIHTNLNNLAYVIYTSGSTGNPKGVLIPHSNVVRLFSSTKHWFNFSSQDVWTLFHSVAFDFSVWEIWGALLNGGRLVIVPYFVSRSPKDFYNLLIDQKVTVLNQTPSAFKQLTEYILNYDHKKLEFLRLIIFGGETLQVALLRPWIERYQESLKLVNMYGITETTVHVTYKVIEAKELEQGKNIIGKRIPDLKLYILDEEKCLLPRGFYGELYVGGRGLAIGYLNRDSLSKERFIENPFLEEEKENISLCEDTRLYKTGDIVRYLPNGELEYLGRIDEQVKIRGYRIELEEIVSVLNQHMKVISSVVVAQESKDHKIDHLIAYLQMNLIEKSSLNLDQDTKDSVQEDLIKDEKKSNSIVEEIKTHLSKFLPDYMIPLHYVLVDEIPLISNGKIDKKKLLALTHQSNSLQEDFIPANTDLEKELCSIWSKVLNVNKVGIYDNFFKLGGHSLLATQIISSIRTRLNIDLPLKVLFEYSTPAALASIINKFSQTSTKEVAHIPISNQLDSIPLSFAQERLWFIERYAEGTNAYNIPGVFKILNNVNLEALELSIKGIISRHEVLRTLIKEDDQGNSYQLVIDDKEFPLKIEKIAIENISQLDQELSKQANHIFDLKNEYPIKVYFCKIQNTTQHIENYLSIVIHHIAFDGWSIDIFLNELISFYNYYLNKSEGLEVNLNLPTMDIQYKDFTLWQRDYLTQEKLEKQLIYWKDKLDNYKTLELITDKPRPSKVNYEGGYLYFELDEDTSKSLRKLAEKLEISLYSILLSGYYLMLRIYSNQNDIVIGTPVANRHYNQVENLIGFFVNSLALRIQIDPTLSIKDFIKQVWNEIIEAQLHQDLPFEKLVEELEIEKDASRHPIFQVQFGVQSFGKNLNYQDSNSINLIDILQPYVIEGRLYKSSQFDIVTFIDDSQTQLTGSFSYAVNLYNESTILNFIKTYVTILKQISELTNNQKQENYRINNLFYLNKDQYNQLINVWNQTNKPYSEDKTIQSLFEQQVEKTPNDLAITYKETKLTYKQLNEKANKLANYLKQMYQIESDTLIGLCLDRNESMIISILAILKAGGGYVPIDPNYPDKRIQFICKDAAIKLILTNITYKQKLESLSDNIIKNLNDSRITDHLKIIAIDDSEIHKQLNMQPIINPLISSVSDNVAYVIYTSGTTGIPKGILMSHKVITKLVAWEKNYIAHYPIKIKVAQFASISFDVSIQEITYSLLNGYELVIIPEEIKLSFDRLVHFIDEQQINRLYFPSTALSILAEKIVEENIILKSLMTIIVSGEELIITSHIINCFQQRLGLQLINHYGPSETHLVSAYILPKSVDEWVSLPSIGKPIDNTKFYILNNDLVLLPIGAIGELYIGGEGLAKGYLNRPEITAERFIDNPFQNEIEKSHNKNAKLYKSGDLVKWSPEGNLQYIGRNDHQVKIRGYRIELREIENVLLSYEGIRQCIVLVKENTTINTISSNDNKYLICYYVAEVRLNENHILSYLQSNLPEYMIPHVFLHMEYLPLTSNGKLNKKALPEPIFNKTDDYISPRNELEKKICQIWSEILNLQEDEIGIRNDFFKLGGNSILAIKLVNIINRYYKSHLKISDIFVYKNIELLVPRITQTKDNYQVIIKLNSNYDKPCMFMIHPGEAGCEVYASLAHKLSSSFNCYGIDSYNLYHENKIDNLHELSNYYLSYIDEVLIKTKQDTYHLLGWSLGGIISLEIASILEQKGNNKIQVYLLDAILEDAYLSSLMDTIDIEKVKEDYKTYRFSCGYEESYIEKIISLVSIEKYLIRINQISSTLNKTKAILFKAMLQDLNDLSFNTSKANEIHNHISNLKYNNIDKIFKNKKNIKLINVKDAYHKNIIEKEELIISKINIRNKKY